jgi:alkylation response protein AidB-like acyl-CoA dehydrogenase
MKTDERPVIDTSKMSAEQRAALELTEAARETPEAKRSFSADLFMGRFNLKALHPYPQQSVEDRDQGDAFLHRMQDLLEYRVDPDEIDRTGEIPDAVIAELAEMGAFGIKIETKYGGLGLSQTNYCRTGMLLGSHCGNLAALISAHQSIGVPQPLILFGTEAQKRKFLPRIAKGEISAFALTEPGVGSDPAKMETHAEPTLDGEGFVLNGTKLWCTNGVKAGVIVVMARTAPKDGKNQITAFVVEMNSPGVEVVSRCRFMGLRALYNAVIRFTNVYVPKENIILAEGKGLRVALTTLNTGRLTLPAACTGLAKRCLEASRDWANERVQWGAAIGKHAAIADKIARMAADTFAMEAMTFYTASLVDRDKKSDIRLEARSSTTRCKSAAGGATRRPRRRPRGARSRSRSSAGCAIAVSTRSLRARARSCGFSLRARRSTHTCAWPGRCSIPDTPPASGFRRHLGPACITPHGIRFYGGR